MGTLLQLTEKYSFCTTKTLITIHCHKNPTFSSFFISPPGVGEIFNSLRKIVLPLLHTALLRDLVSNLN